MICRSVHRECADLSSDGSSGGKHAGRIQTCAAHLGAHAPPRRAAVGVLYGVNESKALSWVGQVDLQPSKQLRTGRTHLGDQCRPSHPAQ